MADIRINSLPSTATSFNTDDYIAIDGASGGTRKMLAATLPLTDVTLGGTSGPSVKSTLSARAPRQGLVFDGTGSTTATVSALGTGAWTIKSTFLCPSSSVAGLWGVAQAGAAGQSYSIYAYLYTDNTLNVIAYAVGSGNYRIATISNFFTTYSGKNVELAVTQSGGTLTIYVNGVSTSFTETTAGGSPPAWNQNYIGTIYYLGGTGTNNIFTGPISSPLIYNRALSASEVVALYEAGAPAGADYNSASNTSVVTGFSNGGYTTFSGASATGFTAAAASGSNYVVNTPAGNTQPVLQVGSRVRVSFTATLTSGAAPTFGIRNNVGGDEGTFTVAAGSNSVIITMTQKSVSDGLGNAVFRSTGATSYAISNFSLTYLGLLLAPDAAQAGGGLTWYDTSGNAANITLPASGVSWNVPSSGYWGGNLTVSGVTTSAGISNSGALTFTAAIGQVAGSIAKNATYGLTYYGVTGSSNDNTMLNASGAVVLSNPAGTTNATLTGNLTVSGTGTSAIQGDTINLGAVGNVATVVNLFRNNASVGGMYAGNSDFNLFGGASAASHLVIKSNGNVLIGTTTDSANGKLQLATHTTSAGGIGFGTDTSLYRSQTGMLALDGLTGSLSQLDLRVGGVQKAFVAWNGGDFYLGAVVGTTVIKSSNTTALTLDSSQNATFAGSVKAASQVYAEKSGAGIAGQSVGLVTQFTTVNSTTYSVTTAAAKVFVVQLGSGDAALCYTSYKSSTITILGSDGTIVNSNSPSSTQLGIWKGANDHVIYFVTGSNALAGSYGSWGFCFLGNPVISIA